MDWSKPIKDFLKSPLGQEVLRTLKDDLHANLIVTAEAQESQEKAFGLLNQARGVILAIGHLQSIAGLASKDE